MIETTARISRYAEHFFAELRPRIERMRLAGVDVIRLDEGAPDLPPAPHIIEALTRAAARPDVHSYQPQRGTASLRQAWSDMYRRVHGVDLDPETEILPLLGSKEGIFHLPLAFVEPGQVVLIPDPGYITYTRGAQIAGGQLCYVPLLPENGYLPDFGALPAEVLGRARLMWLNYPNNPTGAMASVEFFTQAVEFAHQHHLLLCHDAAYTQVTFAGLPAPSLLQVPGAMEVAVEFNTLSKTYNMAGWRAAAVVGAPEVIRTLYLVKSNIDSGQFLPVAEAARVALTGDQGWIAERNAIYARRSRRMVDGLRELGFDVSQPEATLYVWCRAPAGWEGEDFSLALLEQTGVSLTPGTVFGQGGRGYLRISITAPEERIAEALLRMKAWMGTWR